LFTFLRRLKIDLKVCIIIDIIKKITNYDNVKIQSCRIL